MEIGELRAENVESSLSREARVRVQRVRADRGGLRDLRREVRTADAIVPVRLMLVTS